MPPVELQSAEQVVARWRSGADPESPAGPLHGDNLERLIEVKTKYDPTGLFRSAQAIPPPRSAHDGEAF